MKTKAITAISRFINYTRHHGTKRGVTINNLFLLQDFIYSDLGYCKNKHGEIIAILDKMNQDSPDVKTIRKYLTL